MRKSFICSLIVAILLVACQKDAPILMKVEAGVQVEISGDRASIVKADTTRLVIVRDSVADEKTDTVYKLYTSLTLILDSTFMADKMEDSLLLKINDVVFVPTDSTLADSLISFMKKQPGTAINIQLTGQALRSQFLGLAFANTSVLSGYSFHELDPESLADPEITAMLKDYLETERYLREVEEEGGWLGSSAAYMLGRHEANQSALDMMKDKMTPKQRKAYEAERNRNK